VPHTTPILVAAALALASPWATGQTVYRCGNNYSQQPCAGGTAISVNDARSAPQAQRASSVAQADQKLADQMEKARLAQEKNAPKALVIGPQSAASAPQGSAGREGTKPKAGKLEQFTAVSPRAGVEKKKAPKKKGKAGKKTKA
jgi:hypothetical protein